MEIKIGETLLVNKSEEALIEDVKTVVATRNIDRIKERKLREKMRNGWLTQ